jgi:hypothetical protein
VNSICHQFSVDMNLAHMFVVLRIFELARQIKKSSNFTWEKLLTSKQVYYGDTTCALESSVVDQNRRTHQASDSIPQL